MADELIQGFPSNYAGEHGTQRDPIAAWRTAVLQAMLIPGDLLGVTQTGSYATAKLQQEIFRRQWGISETTPAEPEQQDGA